MDCSDADVCSGKSVGSERCEIFEIVDIPVGTAGSSKSSVQPCQWNTPEPSGCIETSYESRDVTSFREIDKYPLGSAVRDALCSVHARERTVGRVLHLVERASADRDHSLDLIGSIAYDTSFVTRSVRSRLVEKIGAASGPIPRKNDVDLVEFRRSQAEKRWFGSWRRPVSWLLGIVAPKPPSVIIADRRSAKRVRSVDCACNTDWSIPP